MKILFAKQPRFPSCCGRRHWTICNTVSMMVLGLLLGALQLRAGSIDMFGLHHTSFGNAILSVVNNAVEVDNMGPSDGVRVDLPGDIVTRYDAEFPGLGGANDQVDGAFLQWTSRGTINGVSDQIISTVRMQDTGSQIATTFDFSPFAASSLTADYFLNGNLVGSQTGINPNGATWTASAWGTDGSTTGTPDGSSGGDAGVTWTFVIGGVPIETPNGATFTVDEVHITSVNLPVEFRYSDVSFTAGNISSITIINETVESVPESGGLDLLVVAALGLYGYQRLVNGGRHPAVLTTAR